MAIKTHYKCDKCGKEQLEGKEVFPEGWSTTLISIPRPIAYGYNREKSTQDRLWCSSCTAVALTPVNIAANAITPTTVEDSIEF